MRSLLRKRNGIVCALIAAVLLSCFSFGFTGKAPGSAVSVTAAGIPATTPVSQLKYTTVGSYIMITGYTGTSPLLVLPASIDGKPVKHIADKAFYRNKTITYVYLPAGVTTIGARAFGECDSLTEFAVNTGSTAFTVKDGALYSKDMTVLKVFPGGLAGSFTVPKTVKKIDAYAFYYCYQITRIQMYNAVAEIGNGAFAFCWNMTYIRLSDNLNKLGKYAFYNCESLTYIYLPKSITSIAADALLGFIDSSDNRMYNFVDGIGCVKDSYAYNYVISIRLTPTAALPKGDVDGDGKVQVNDARFALKAAAHIIALNADQIQAADFDGNQIVDVSDARKILRHAADIEPLP